MRHIPSLKTIRQAFEQKFIRYHQDFYAHAVNTTSPETALRWLKEIGRSDSFKLRDELTRWRNREIKTQDMLETANTILRGSGIEYLHSENNRARAFYVNMGDTYSTTLVLDIMKERVWITSWGAWVEAEERAGNRFA